MESFKSTALSDRPRPTESPVRRRKAPEAYSHERRHGLNDRRWCETGGRRCREERDALVAAEYRAPGGSNAETVGLPDPPSGRVWKVRDVAEFLQASESWVRHAAASGGLPCTKIGGLLRFDPDEIRSLARAEPPTRVLPRRRG